jgi:hypothetical protein
MMIRKIKIPSPVKFTDSQQYFKELYTLNKVYNSAFSYRSFAAKIKWPVSYLSDLVAGRKPLTISRAIEFSEFFSLNSVEREHLVLFAMPSDSLKEKKLRHDPNHLLHHNPQLDDLLLTCDVLTLYRLLSWKKKNMTAAEINEEFLVFFEPTRLDQALTKIEELKIFKWKDDGTLLSADSTKIPQFIDHAEAKQDKKYEGLEWHKSAAMNLLSFIEQPKSPSAYNSSLVAIPRGQFMPVAMKMLELRNWIEDLSKEHLAASNEPDKSSHLMQLDLNLFPVINRK